MVKKHTLLNALAKQTSLQVMAIIGLAFLIFFRIVPIYGLQLAFKELLPGFTIQRSPWVGLKHFRAFFLSGDFSMVMRNTITLSLAHLVIGFPVPIIFALLLNEIRLQKTKALIQGISYLPYFLSWVVVFGVLHGIIAFQGGVLNDILLGLHLVSEPVNFLGTPNIFKPLMVITAIWKDAGWSAIIYTAAIAGIDEQLYEAARVDGAGKFRQVLGITVPLIMPTVIIMFILRCGAILDAGFDQILVFRNAITHNTANILDIFVYDIGLQQGRFGYATAVGLFKSVVGFCMVFGANKLASRYNMGFF
ncbi:MAG: ABC transporter permease subunit [Treponema sp.]|jgi:putative aldouronate transport system permease protein|nr:ABC transporter permease subunit [Treponema sp.]